MNVVIYARYSDSKQREESIEGQLKVCYAYAERNGYNVIGEYIDRAISAKTDDRPNFQKMIRESGKKFFQGILVYRLDRFARNRYDSAKYKYYLKKNGVKVISASEPISDDASGVLLESVLEGMAEYYSVELAEKVNRGLSVNAEKCLSNGGTTPLGYRIENKHYVIDEEKAPVVREIYEKYADGWSAKQICESLNERHIRSARGAAFNKSSLHTILKNRKYLGIYIYNGKEIPGGMPQIVEKELFDRVQARMTENKQAPARARAKAEYILSGKLFCGYCKEKMIGHSSNQISKKGVIFNYYKCKNSGGGKPCKKKMVQKNYIEDIVVAECKKLLTKSNIHRIAREVVKIARQMDDRTEQKRLEALLKQKQGEKTNQMQSLRLCSSDEVRQMIFEDLSQIGQEIKELERQIELEKTRHYVVSEKQVEEYLSQLAEGDIRNRTYRRSLIRLFINRIFLYDDKITITFNTGDEEVTITEDLLDKIENNLDGKDICLLNAVVHHACGAQCAHRRFFFSSAVLRPCLQWVSFCVGEKPLEASRTFKGFPLRGEPHSARAPLRSKPLLLPCP